MPSVQRGQVFRLAGGSWAYRYYATDGKRRQVGGFKTRSEAAAALELSLESVRLGPLVQREPPTVQALVDEFLAQYVCESNTHRTATS